MLYWRTVGLLLINPFADWLKYSYDKDDTSGNSGVSPDLIKDEGFGGVYEIDTSNAINIGFFGNNGNGGCW